MDLMGTLTGLTQDLYGVQSFIRACALSLVAGLPICAYGAPGRGKSEVFYRIFDSIQGASTFIFTCGESTSDESLLGGLNISAFQDSKNPRLEFNVDKSFLPKNFIHFDEIWDMMTSAALILKGIMTSGKLTNGTQVFESEVFWYTSASNKDPNELAAESAAVAALMERWAVQIRVDVDLNSETFHRILWNEKKPQRATIRFKDLVALRQLSSSVTFSREMKGVVSQLFGEAAQNGQQISPRLAKYGIRLIAASAVLDDRGSVNVDDLSALTYLAGTQLGGNASELLDRFKERDAAEKAVRELALCVDELDVEYGVSNQSPIHYLKVAKRASRLIDSYEKIRVTDELKSRKDDLLKDARELFRKSQEMATCVTRI